MIKILRQVATIAALALSLAACGGSSGGASPLPPPPPPPPPPPVSTAEAFQFLNQATFGATLDETQAVINLSYQAWIDQQIAEPESLQLPYLRSLPRPQNLAELQADRVDMWFRNVVNGDDQLRQRVAFALSEILVVSQLGALVNAPYALADYYDKQTFKAFEGLSHRPWSQGEESGLGRVLEENAQAIWELMQDPKTHVYIAGLSKSLEAFHKAMAKVAGSEARLRWTREEMVEQGRWSELFYG